MAGEATILYLTLVLTLLWLMFKDMYMAHHTFSRFVLRVSR
jgi:hypothetical protein